MFVYFSNWDYLFALVRVQLLPKYRCDFPMALNWFLKFYTLPLLTLQVIVELGEVGGLLKPLAHLWACVFEYVKACFSLSESSYNTA